ncbi:RNA-binding protein [Schizosaccharomyces cryophilus OY26]|uniref:RNA-binding protein n=1 Tax=Schizosaccharomyces cryophilus (strain OY26 / ATCC MYA-4695 / CBS 11777 / NBRC 106824 / NRRL Y48691) TaxID=653667 RepID=S9X9S4_SCHCR|nr:RNA-binding protein [Schizosaccharomyces cryophilus OY26]EPY53897.1 RNA-binding protein [Schizosaccharomyces cryophilus OY26]
MFPREWNPSVLISKALFIYVLQGIDYFVNMRYTFIRKRKLSVKKADIGPIKHTVVVTNPETGENRGYGFVTFSMLEDAERAIQELRNKKLNGRILRMDYAAHRKRAGPSEEKEKELEQVSNRKPQAPRQDNRPRLIIRNLPWSIKKPKDLEPYFEKFGKIREIRVPTKPGGRMCGFAFVWMQDREAAQKAMDAVNGTKIDNRPVAVDWALSKNAYESNVTSHEESDEKSKENNESEEEEIKEDILSDSDAHSSVVPENNDEEDLEKDDAEQSEASQEELSSESDSESVDKSVDRKENLGDTIFIRNILFECTEQQLYQHFRQFGPLAYAKIVRDPVTDKSLGRAFVKFRYQKDCNDCLELAAQVPKTDPTVAEQRLLPSVLVEEDIDSDSVASRFLLNGRILNVTKAVTREEAGDFTQKSIAERKQKLGKGVDRRHLFLLNEGRIGTGHPLFEKLSDTDKSMRSMSINQRKKLLESNPTLHLSLSRLSIRNLSRHIDHKMLAFLGRQAIRCFKEDVEKGLRQELSDEEKSRDKGQSTKRGKNGSVLKQAKVELEKSGAGRSKGYGFLEFVSHKYALMALRWLNGREVTVRKIIQEEIEWARSHKLPEPEMPVMDFNDRPRRLIVEFAIENIKVVKRRQEKETTFREKAKQMQANKEEEAEQLKRKRTDSSGDDGEKEKKAKVARIIQQKRMKRRQRKH